MNEGFPRWSAPLLGAIVGAICGYKADPGVASPIYIGGGALIGALAGCMIFLLDRKPPTNSAINPAPGKLAVSSSSSTAGHGQPVYRVESGLVGRFLALVACLICLIPIAGFLIGIAATAVNWNANDWTRKASRIATGIATVITAIVVVSIILE